MVRNEQEGQGSTGEEVTVSKQEIQAAKELLRANLKAKGYQVLRVRVKKHAISLIAYLKTATPKGLTKIVCNWPKPKKDVSYPVQKRKSVKNRKHK